MRKVHKSPISRIRTRQADTRKDSIRAHGYQKGKRKQLSGNMNVITRTTDPQTVYRTDACTGTTSSTSPISSGGVPVRRYAGEHQ